MNERIGGYLFRDPALARLALSPATVVGENNERLEFLGDRLLDAAVTLRLVEIAPQASEGDLSILRASCVNDAMLALVGKAMELESKFTDGGGHTDARIGDAVEALAAAVYFDRGFETLCECIAVWFGARFSEIEANLPRLEAYIESIRNPKGRLQEYAAHRRLPAPVYRTQRTRGRHRCTCRLGEREQSGTGEGGSRARAEREAAASLLVQLLGGEGMEVHAHLA